MHIATDRNILEILFHYLIRWTPTTADHLKSIVVKEIFSFACNKHLGRYTEVFFVFPFRMSVIKECMIEVVQAITPGKVASYAQVAELVQARCTKRVTAQVVGWILSGMPKSERSRLPWWRVVNKQGFISTLKLGDK